LTWLEQFGQLSFNIIPPYPGAFALTISPLFYKALSAEQSLNIAKSTAPKAAVRA
jgi:hypothetical protein